MRWLCRDVDTEPRTHAFFDRPNLFGGKRTEAVHQPHRGCGNNALYIKRAGAQKLDRHGDFEPGLSKGGRVGNERDEGSV